MMVTEPLNPPVLENPASDQNLQFRAIVDTHQRSVYALAYELTGNHHDAEDLSQEVFIKVYRSLSSFRGDSKMFSWLYRITVNTFLNKKNKKTLLFRKLTGDFQDVDRSLSIQDSTDEHVMLDVHINRALERLSSSERAAFVLRHTEDLPVKEVAEIMEVAEGTVKSLLHRAVKKLRKHLAFYANETGISIGR